MTCNFPAPSPGVSERPPPRALLVFVDGLGWGADDPEHNPVARHAPRLHAWLRTHGRPIDATLGVPGLPQSATGQTALLTGCNAPAAVGRHVESFPGPALQEIVREYNLLRLLSVRGYPVAFANAYAMDEGSQRMIRLRPSVTTVATLSALGRVRGPDDLARGEAVSHDLTRAHLRRRGVKTPLIAPDEAAAHLAGIARVHAFTLFEFFETDLAGHRGDPRERAEVLERLDTFWDALRGFVHEPGALLLFTSDHGNIEEPDVTTHSLNPVPYAAEGARAEEAMAEVKRLDGIAPALLRLWP
jgi:2,3-bisphosphoglycerate-independent phosphoglycerate mutase